MKKELRDFQLKVVKKCINSNEDILISAPTGCGKTFVAEMIMNELSKQNKDFNFIFVVPRIILIQQFLEELTAFKESDFDIIQAENTKLSGKRFILASKDSLDNYIEKLPDNLIMFIDEVHEGLKQSFKLVQKIKPVRLFGLTATPERSDGLSFIKGIDLNNEEKIHKYALFDKYIDAISIREAQNLGYLCNLKYLSRNDLETLDIKSKGVNEFTEEEIKDLFDKYNIWGDLVKTYKRYGKNIDGTFKPAIGFTNTVKMAERVANIFNNAGFIFKVITGNTSINERFSFIEDLKTGKINGLVNADLLTYGFNCPEVSYIFSCRHIKSRSLWVQMIGRGLRPGKPDLFFIDHADSISEFSNPYYDIPFESGIFNWNVNGMTAIYKKKLTNEKKETAKIRRELYKYVFNEDEKLVLINQENRNKFMLDIIKKLKMENINMRKLLAKQYE